MLLNPSVATKCNCESHTQPRDDGCDTVFKVRESAYLILPKTPFKLNSVALDGGQVFKSGRKAHLCQQSLTVPAHLGLPVATSCSCLSALFSLVSCVFLDWFALYIRSALLKSC